MTLQTRRAILVNTVAAFSATVTCPLLIFPAGATNSAPVTHIVEITKFQFHLQQLLVKPGDTIIWKNLDIVSHTASADDDSWDTGTIPKDKSISLVVTKDMAGDYFCRFHPHMKAKLEISI